MSNTVIVIVVLVVALIIFMMWQNAQTQASQNEQMMLMMQNQGAQGQANIWSSMGDWANIIGGVGGLFGGGSSDPTGGSGIDGDIYEPARMINTSAYPRVGASPFAVGAPYQATTGFENLQDMVEYGEGMELNM